MHLVPPEDSDLKNPAKIKLSIIQTFWAENKRITIEKGWSLVQCKIAFDSGKWSSPKSPLAD